MSVALADLKEVQKLTDDPNMVTYCCMMARPGLTHWLVEIEYTLFKPDTDANLGFHIATIKWPSDFPVSPSSLYAVACFERRAQMFAESILWRNGLRKVTEGFTLMVIGASEMAKFPIRGPRVFYLENHSQGAGNVIYTNDPAKLQVAHDHEMKQCQVYFDEHKAWLATEEGKAIADAFWKKHPEGKVE